MIEELKKMAKEKKEKIIASGNLDEIHRIELAERFLSDPQCFFKVRIDVSIPILVYIGIPENQVKDVYFKLISPENNLMDDQNYVYVNIDDVKKGYS